LKHDANRRIHVGCAEQGHAPFGQTRTRSIAEGVDLGVSGCRVSSVALTYSAHFRIGTSVEVQDPERVIEGAFPPRESRSVVADPLPVTALQMPENSGKLCSQTIEAIRKRYLEKTLNQ
jgi:hypothetical protein